MKKYAPMKTNFTRVFVDKDRDGDHKVVVYKFWGLLRLGFLWNASGDLVFRRSRAAFWGCKESADNAARNYLTRARKPKFTRYEIFEEVQSVWRD